MDNNLKKANSLMNNSKSKENNKKEERNEEKLKKELEQLKNKLEEVKKNLLKKFPFINSISLIPPQASQFFEEEQFPESKNSVHLYILIPDEKEKEYAKLKLEAIKLVSSIKPKVWVNLNLMKELWEICYDGKNEMIDAIAMSVPLYDKGLLGALNVANIHKIMCLKKFESYIVSYVIAGSIVRGEATKTSDVDVYVIVDDTDVKRMHRLELKEKLKQIIYTYVIEAGEISGVKNKLSPQVYLLTEFWEGIRESIPVFFTFVRDGVPLYDKGTFMPWKLLLKMGKISGTPEAIERFLTSGEKVGRIVKQKLLDIATEDIYWSVLTPSQGALMIYGLAPPTPKETVQLMKKTFYEKEKLLEKKYIDFLEHVVIDIYKGYEHQKVKEVSGKEIDDLVKGAEDYIKRLRKLVKEIEKRSSEKTVLDLYNNVVVLIKSILGKTSEAMMIKKFEDELVSKGKLPLNSLNILKKLVKIRKEFSSAKKDKIDKQEIERIRKDSQQLISLLTEYSQRKSILEIEKLRFKTLIGDKEGELYLFGKKIFIIHDLKKKEIKLIDLDKNSIHDVSISEFE